MVIAHMGLSQQIHLSNLEAYKCRLYTRRDTHERVRVPIQGYAKVVEPEHSALLLVD